MSDGQDLLSSQIFGASIEFGVGISEKLAYYAKDLGASKLLLVTDEGIIKAGVADKITRILDASDVRYAVFHNVQPNPIDRNVMDGADAYRRDGCDAILGLGGGSAMDVAKAISVVTGNPGHISDYYYSEIPGDMPTVIAVPTTSGTGTEVSRGAVITDTRDNTKKLVLTGPASLAVVDSELTLSMPPSLTAATGMDAICHSIEAYVSNIYNPFAGAIAIAGIKLVAENLREAVKHGDNMEARKNMSMASAMGALAFKKGLGAVHSLAHQLSTEADVPHGVANAIMLPHVMEFNLEAVPEKYADVAKAMGVNTWDMTPAEAAKASVEAVRRLSDDIDIPKRLRDIGVKEEHIPAMTEKAMADHCHARNPRICDKESMAALYKLAF
jgi:alcohol dehydrogenase